MSSLLPSQVRVLIISGKFLWRAGTVWYRFKMKDLIHQSGFILMRVNQEKHRRQKRLSLKGRNNQFMMIHLRFIVTKKLNDKVIKYMSYFRFNEFDHKFFGISDAEADFMDPQQKLLLQCAYRALEDAGIPLEKVSGTQTGVYIGNTIHLITFLTFGCF